MRQASLGIFLLVASLLSAAVAGAQPNPSTERAAPAKRSACPWLETIDYSRLTPGHTPQSLSEARASLRAGDQPNLGAADVVIRFFAPPGFGGSRSTWATAQRVHGRWRLVREDRPLVSAPPPPPDAPPDPDDARPQRPRSPIIPLTAPLEADRAAILDAVLADPCLAREPDTAPAALPLRGGGLDICGDGASFFLQIERASSVRTFAHACTPRWRAGAIKRALEGAQGDPAQSLTVHSLTPRIFVDDANRNIVEAPKPKPLLLTVLGDIADRAMTLDVAGVRVADGAIGETISGPNVVPGAAVTITLAGCAEPFTGALPAPVAALSVDGCRLTLRAPR